MRAIPLLPTLALASGLLACSGGGPPSPGPEPEGGRGRPLPASLRATDDIEYHIDALTQTSGGIQVDGWAYVEKAATRDSEISLVLQSVDGAQRAFKGWPVPRRDVSAYYKNPDLDDSGFSVWIPRSVLGSGDYRLGIYIRRAGRESLEYTARIVRIE